MTAARMKTASYVQIGEKGRINGIHGTSAQDMTMSAVTAAIVRTACTEAPTMGIDYVIWYNASWNLGQVVMIANWLALHGELECEVHHSQLFNDLALRAIHQHADTFSHKYVIYFLGLERNYSIFSSDCRQIY